MNRKSFFQKIVLGAFAIWKAPEILAETKNIIKTPNRTFHMIGIREFTPYSNLKTYGIMHYMKEIEKEKMQIERSFLFGRQWTPDQEKQLLKTRR